MVVEIEIIQNRNNIKNKKKHHFHQIFEILNGQRFLVRSKEYMFGGISFFSRFCTLVIKSIICPITLPSLYSFSVSTI